MKMEDLAKHIQRGDQLALARAITLVENRKKGYRELMKNLHPPAKKARKIGITGSPGSGKSTLVACLLERLKIGDHSIGVLAVDPTSPISGGALLGDRIRMVEHSNDENVFIRSIASRGSLGGLSNAVPEIIELVESSGRDLIIVETVGVGQSEIDVVNVADVVIMVLTPGAGDEIQIFKAGIIEIADIFVINKADLGGADIKAREIQSYFTLSDKIPPVVPTSATQKTGIEELIAAIEDYQNQNREAIGQKKNSLRKNFILKIVEEKFRNEIATSRDFSSFLEVSQDMNPYQVAEVLYQKVRRAVIHDQKS